jgi:hypothetical protein
MHAAPFAHISIWRFFLYWWYNLTLVPEPEALNGYEYI